MRANDVMTSPERITRAENAREALGLRLQGLNFDQIGYRMGFSRQRAHTIVTEELGRVNAERNAAAGELRTLEAERLDRLQAAVWERALGGDLKAFDRVLAIMSRRARLLGLDAQPNTLSSDEAMLLVRGLIAAVQAEADPDTARRIRARVGALTGCRNLPVDSGETPSEIDLSTDLTPDLSTCETLVDPG